MRGSGPVLLLICGGIDDAAGYAGPAGALADRPGGGGGAGGPANRAALALAERLGVSAEVYPGDHGGFGPHAAAFAARLEEAFR